MVKIGCVRILRPAQREKKIKMVRFRGRKNTYLEFGMVKKKLHLLESMSKFGSKKWMWGEIVFSRPMAQRKEKSQLYFRACSVLTHVVHWFSMDGIWVFKYKRHLEAFWWISACIASRRRPEPSCSLSCGTSGIIHGMLDWSEARRVNVACQR